MHGQHLMALIAAGIRDAAAIVTMLSGVLLVVRRRSVSSAMFCLLLGLLVWLLLFGGGADLGVSVFMLLIFGYSLAADIGLISTESTVARNMKMARFLFGKRAEERWRAALARMHESERRASGKR